MIVVVFGHKEQITQQKKKEILYALPGEESPHNGAGLRGVLQDRYVIYVLWSCARNNVEMCERI